MSIDIDNLGFVHIPKNAGTSIVSVLKPKGVTCYGHEVDVRTISKNCIVVLRNPIQRFCSAVNYALKRWNKLTHIKKIIDAKLLTPNDWADHFFDSDSKYHGLIKTEIMNDGNHKIGDFTLKYRWTYSYQHYYINNPKFIILYDNLNTEFEFLMRQIFDDTIVLPKQNQSYKDYRISDKNTILLDQFYNIDMVLYSFIKNKDYQSRLSIA